MGDAVGVFHPAIAQDSCELIGCSVVEAAVGPHFVVLLSPVGDLGACIEQIAKPVGPQALFAKSPVEALDVSVLGGLAGLDVAQLDLPLQTPSQEVPARQFGAVVAANRLRQATSRDHLVKHARNSAAREASVDLQRQALACKRIHHAQYADRASGSNHVVGEVQSPLLVSCRQRHTRRSAADAVLALLPLQAESSFAVHPEETLVVHSLTFAFQQHL